MQIIDGRKLAQKIRKEVKLEIQRLGLAPSLAVILVGKNPASHLYVALKERACKKTGINFEKHVFTGTEPQGQILAKIQELNEREDIHGILVQVPLPAGYEEAIVISQIDPKKDVDGFHQVNLRAIIAGEPRIFPAVALAIAALIDEAAAHLKWTDLKNRHVALLVNRMEFAAPLEYLLEKRGAEVQLILRPKTITLAHEKIIRQADVLVVARGRADFVNGAMLKSDAIVIDVGTNQLPGGKIVGDVNFESTKEKTGFLTPVPGGVGPMTVAMLLKNILALAKSFSK